ncbi:MAG: Stf0 family sulfotransferase [Marinibacterium sp.]
MQSLIERKLAAPSVHEKKIPDTFDGQVAYSDGMERPGGTLGLLLFANRSGSNLLAEHLNASGHFRGFAEVLNFNFVAKAAGRHGVTTFPDYIRRMARQGADAGTDKKTDGETDGGIFGMKCSAGQLMMLARWNILAMFDTVRIVNIEREDLVEQAVSMSIAKQTGQWSSDMDGRAEPGYDFDQIRTSLDDMAQMTAAKRAAIALLDLPSITVTYRAVVEDPAACVRRACDLFGVPSDFTLPETTRLQKQANARNADFAARFRTDMQARLIGN